MAKKFIDKVTLSSGMSLMLGNKPEQICLGKICVDKPQLEINKFGLFESSTPNFETFYPQIKSAEDIKPKDSDFIYPVFRMLSEVIVRKSYNPVDFSMNGVLKSSMKKLLGQTVYPNHDAIVGNELGSVSEVEWQESYKAKNGIIIPAGINATLKIDALSHPNVARKIQMEPPAIHSNSVTVEFEWEMSHPSLTSDEFWRAIGTLGKDGKLIRRIASNIRNYHETSFVPHGADPFAQKTDDKGKITNPEYANSVYSLSAQGKERPSFYYFNYREDLINLSSNTSENLEDINNLNQMKKITILASQLALANILAVQFNGQPSVEVELTDDNLAKLNEKLSAGDKAETELANAKTQLSETQTQLAAKTAEATTLTSKVTELTGKVTTLENSAKTSLDGFREKVKTAYTALKGESAEQAILTNIANADEALLTTLHKQYTEELEQKFPSTCNDCHSTNISKASSKTGQGVGEQKPKGPIQLADDSSIEEELTNENSNRKFILGQ